MRGKARKYGTLVTLGNSFDVFSECRRAVAQQGKSS